MMQSELATGVKENRSVLETATGIRLQLRPEYGVTKTYKLPERFAELPLISKTNPKMVLSAILASIFGILIVAILVGLAHSTESPRSIYETLALGLMTGVLLIWPISVLFRCTRLFTSLSADIKLDSKGIQSPRDFGGLLEWAQISNVHLNYKGSRAFTVQLQVRDGSPLPNRALQTLLFGEPRKNVVVLHLTFNSESKLAGEAIAAAACQFGGALVTYPGT